MKKVFIKRHLPRIIFSEVSEETGIFNRDLIFKIETSSGRKEKLPLPNQIILKEDENFNDESLNKEIKEILQINETFYEE